MRGDSRKSASHKLYFGAKMICILFGIELYIILLVFVFMAVHDLVSPVNSDLMYSNFVVVPKNISGNGVVGFLTFGWIYALALIMINFIQLFRNFKEIHSGNTKRISFILGVLVWWYCFKVSIFVLGDGCILTPPFIISIIIGWGTYRVTHHFLSIAASRLQGDNEKPEDPTSPGETPQGEEETV